MSTTSGRLRVAALQVGYDDNETAASRWARISCLVLAHRHCDLVVLPELWDHGAFSPANWSQRAVALTDPMIDQLRALAASAGVTLHAGSVIERGVDAGPEGRGLWNTSVVIGPDGSIAATYRKIHRFGFGDGEPLLLEAGDSPTVVDVHGVPTGLAICYDMRFPELFRELVDLGAKLVVVPAAWPAARREHWQLLGRARALENQVFVVQVNNCGTHGGVLMGGHSQIVDPRGQLLAEAGDTEEVLVVELEPTEVDTYRRDFPVLADRRLGTPALQV